MDDLFGKMQELLSDPESMKQIAELAQMLESETASAPPTEDCPPPKNGGPAFDPIMLLKIGEMMNSMQNPDENTSLLLALRPHLKAERQERVDRAVKILKLLHVYSAMKESGMLQNFL